MGTIFCNIIGKPYNSVSEGMYEYITYTCDVVAY